MLPDGICEVEDPVVAEMLPVNPASYEFPVRMVTAPLIPFSVVCPETMETLPPVEGAVLFFRDDPVLDTEPACMAIPAPRLNFLSLVEDFPARS